MLLEKIYKLLYMVKRNTVLTCIALTLFVSVLVACYIRYNGVYVISKVNNKGYFVQDLDDKQQAADKLAKIAVRLEKLVKHLSKKYPKLDSVKRLNKRFDSDNIKETYIDSEYTSYTVDKGENMSYCLRTKNNDERTLHDINTMMFVSIHELAHVMTVTQDHSPEFHENFQFILKEAIELSLIHI